MDKKIQFLLLSDGASHKFYGVNPVWGLQRLGINAEFWFPRRKLGKLIENPDYVLLLKPNMERDKELILSYRAKGAKIGLILLDEWVKEKWMSLFDFVLAGTKGWQKDFNEIIGGLPCFVVTDEWDYYMNKIHKPDTFKIVACGYKQTFIQYLPPILDTIKTKYTDINLISDWTINDKYSEKFKEFNLVKIARLSPSMMQEDRDRAVIEQFNQYDVAIDGQMKECLHRPSTTEKGMISAGLPLVTLATSEHSDLWYDNSGIRLYQVHEPKDWIKWLDYLSESKIRQQIADYNYNIVKEISGLKESARSFITALEDYENKI